MHFHIHDINTFMSQDNTSNANEREKITGFINYIPWPICTQNTALYIPLTNILHLLSTFQMKNEQFYYILIFAYGFVGNNIGEKMTVRG